jgi:hypothetical protein
MAGQSIGNLKSWSLNDTEIAYNLEKDAKTTSSTEASEWKLYVPKIMPLITKDYPKETTVVLSSAMFANEKSCKPVVQKSIKERNYIVATRPDNCSFAHAYKTHDMKLEVEVLHENLDNLRITNTIDNSTSSSNASKKG